MAKSRNKDLDQISKAQKGLGSGIITRPTLDEQQLATVQPSQSKQAAGTPKTTVRHNKDGSVDVTVGSETQNLSKNEFKNLTEVKKAQAEGRNITGSGFAGTPQATVLNNQGGLRNTVAIEDIGQNVPELQPDSNTGEHALTIASALGGAGAGALAGAALAPATAGASVPIGAGIGLLTSVLGKVGLAKRNDVAEARNNFVNARGNIKAIIQATNQGILDPIDAVSMYNQQLASINLAERQLKELTDNDLDKFLSGGKDELADIQSFRQIQDIYQRRLQEAIIAPNPNAVQLPQDNINP